MPKKPTFEQVLNNAFLEEARFEYPILDESKTKLNKHHFRRMTIEDVQRAANEDLISILEANSIRIDEKTLDLRRLVLYEKCFHLHMAIARISRGRNCGYCLAEITCSRRCSQCKMHRYCDRDCQIKHWPVHKAFCNLHQRRTEEQQRLSQAKLDEDPTILERSKKFVMSRMWNGKEDNYFQETLAVVQKTWKDMPVEYIAMFLTSLPPTVAQAHGPMELWKMTSYVLEQCETTEFQHEQKAWLSVLEYICDPHWPHNAAHPETLFLQPNVLAFVERNGLYRLLKLMLNKPALLEPITSVLHHLSRYREIVKVSTQQHYSEPTIPLGSNSGGGAVLFNRLTPEIRELILNDFLRGKNAQGITDQMNFGRCSKASAQLVCEVLDRTAQSQFINGSCKLGNLMTSFEELLKRAECRLEKDLGGLQVKQAGSEDPQRFLQPECQRWSLKIHELSQAFENAFSGLRQVFCAHLQARYSMQVGDRDKSKSSLHLEILILRSCENAIELRTKWVAPYSNIVTWISQNNAEQAAT